MHQQAHYGTKVHENVRRIEYDAAHGPRPKTVLLTPSPSRMASQLQA